MASSRVPGPTGTTSPAPAPGVFPPSSQPPGRFSRPGPVGGTPPAVNGRADSGSGSAATAAIEFVSPAADAVFLISTAPQMPTIEVEARVTGVAPDPTATAAFSWTIEVSFDEAAVCTFGKNGVVFTDSFTASVTGGRFTPAFSWIRGGRLTLTARTTVSGTALSKSLQLWIFGTDPGWQAISAELGDDTLRRIVKFESGGIQFENDPAKSHQGVPKLNRGLDGGGGACQITPPTADDLWNWKTNVRSGKSVFASKQAAARAYPNAVANSDKFRLLVQALNQRRAAAGLSALTVRVPPFDADQLRRDTIRGFNGFAGGMHEFRLSVVNGELRVANVNDRAGTADAVWEPVPVADRPRGGDPDYVNHVLNTNI